MNTADPSTPYTYRTSARTTADGPGTPVIRFDLWTCALCGATIVEAHGDDDARWMHTRYHEDLGQ